MNKIVAKSLLGFLLILIVPCALSVEPIGKVTGYEISSDDQVKGVDGSTSASKLRAKKSHFVSESDETKLTVFLGLFAMAIIIFFLITLNDKE